MRDRLIDATAAEAFPPARYKRLVSIIEQAVGYECTQRRSRQRLARDGQRQTMQHLCMGGHAARQQ